MAKGLGLGLCELLSEIFLKRGDKINSLTLMFVWFKSVII